VTISVKISKEKTFLPAYHHLLDDQHDVELLFGGRDSGKTHFIAQLMLLECMRSKYFRCVLVKKVGDSIKDAQWQAMYDIAQEWNVLHLFKFRSSPLSVQCINGNKFIARGMDKPGKVRGITNPTHLWVEEANQLSASDYINLSTTLRSSEGSVKEYLAFNPEAEHGKPEDFWLYKKFYEGVKNIYTKFSRAITEKIEGHEIKIRYRSTHTTYKDNKFCSAERRAKLEQLKYDNPYYYDVFTRGIWGKRLTGQEMFSKFWSRSKHVRPVPPDYARPFHIWFDFNRIPYSTCEVVQMEVKSGFMEIRAIDEICLPPPVNSIEDIQKVFAAKYGRCKFIYYSGDPSGRSETQTKTSGEARSMFDQVDRSFRKYIHNSSNMVPRSAPSLMSRKQAWVDVFTERAKIKIIVDPKCSHLIEDVETAVEDVTGGWMKKKEKDAALGKNVEVVGHALDAMTYGIYANFPQLFEEK